MIERGIKEMPKKSILKEQLPDLSEGQPQKVTLKPISKNGDFSPSLERGSWLLSYLETKISVYLEISMIVSLSLSLSRSLALVFGLKCTVLFVS